MEKTKKILRKIIYAVLFSVMIFAFIYLSNKYTNDQKEPTPVITDYYKSAHEDKFEVIRGLELISLLKRGKHLIFIGSHTSAYSAKYLEELEIVMQQTQIDKIYYYDLNNDKAQKNSNYYTIRELLKGSLTTTDGSHNNLLAPSFYIVNDGEVKYYNTETVAMKNTDTIEDYWNTTHEAEFYLEVTTAINKYYLNK